MLTPNNIHVILELIDRQTIMFVSKTIGEVGLSEFDKENLQRFGIDWKQLYDESKDLVKLNFQLGMLSNLLSENRIQSLTAPELIKFIQTGKHVPLNERERATIDSIKMQSLADIRSNNNKIFQDINNVVAKVSSSNRANQEEYLRGKIIEGVSDRLTRKQIATEIARATGDWSRNFNKAVAYISHTALNEGRAAMVERRYGGNEKARIYFQVQADACQYCIKAYLKDSESKEPKIFTLKELQANGTNIGRKAAEYLPTLGALHVHCRCLATEYQEGTIWNGSKFVFPKEREHMKIDRPKIKVVIDGVEHLV